MYLGANRFSMAWENGIQMPFTFFVFAWHWKTDLNFAFCFSFSLNFEKRIWTSYFFFRFRFTLKNGFEFHFSIFVFASLWKTDLNFLFALCLLLKNRLEFCLSFFFFKVMRKRKTKNKFISVFQSDAKTKNEIRSAKPFFKVRRQRKTKSKIQICFSMSCENEKWKWHLNSLFPCHRKTAGTKVHAFRVFISSETLERHHQLLTIKWQD